MTDNLKEILDLSQPKFPRWKEKGSSPWGYIRPRISGKEGKDVDREQAQKNMKTDRRILQKVFHIIESVSKNGDEDIYNIFFFQTDNVCVPTPLILWKEFSR